MCCVSQQLNQNLGNLQAAVHAKADAAHVLPRLQALQRQLQQGLQQLQGDLQRKADAGRVTQHINTLTQQLNHNFANLQTVLNANAAQTSQQFNALGQQVNRHQLELANLRTDANTNRAHIGRTRQDVTTLQTAMHAKADQTQTTQRLNELNQRVLQNQGTLGALLARNQQNVRRNDLAQLEDYTNELAETQADQLQETIALMDGMNRQIAHLETENR